MSRIETTNDGATESSPLLSSSLETDEDRSWAPKAWHAPERLTFIFMIGVLLASLGDQWMDPPQTRIYESIICYRYYERVDPSKLLVGREGVGPGAIGGVNEMWCKADAVQGELASLRGWQQLFDGIPSLLLALPMGWAADRFGRKPIVLAGLIAFVVRALWIQLVTWFWQAFDIRMVWLSTLFGSLGGGSAVTTTIFFVILSDITPEADRAAIFLRVGAFNLLAALIMPPFAAVLMEVNPWIPNLGGTVLEIAPAVLFAFCPETLNYRHASLGSSSQAVPPSSNRNAREEEISANRDSSAVGLLSRWITKLKTSTSILTNDWRVPILIIPFLMHFLLGLIGALLLQYVSKRYGIKMSKAILVTTIRTGVIVLLLFFILPSISTALMRKYRLSAQRKDLYLARVSMLFLAVGWTLVGLAPNIPTVAIALAISSLGHGGPLLLRSFLTSLVPKHHIARVYSIMSLVDIFGMMFGWPLMAGLFKRGLASGGLWIGLPFYFLGLAAACFAVLLTAVGLRKGEDEYVPVPEDE